MAEYINKNTGVVVNTDSVLGGAWVKKEEVSKKETTEEKPKRKKK